MILGKCPVQCSGIRTLSGIFLFYETMGAFGYIHSVSEKSRLDVTLHWNPLATCILFNLRGYDSRSGCAP